MIISYFKISPQITIPDEFMERVQTDADWYLFCPYELKEKLGIELDEVFGTDFKVSNNDKELEYLLNKFI